MVNGIIDILGTHQKALISLTKGAKCSKRVCISLTIAIGCLAYEVFEQDKELQSLKNEVKELKQQKEE